MTVSELCNILSKLVEKGYGETDVIALCDDFDKISRTRRKRYFSYLDESDICYQSGNVELGFCNYDYDCDYGN
jgi:hypothetical protein